VTDAEVFERMATFRILALEARVKALEAWVKELEAKVKELEAKVKELESQPSTQTRFWVGPLVPHFFLCFSPVFFCLVFSCFCFEKEKKNYLLKTKRTRVLLS
jgi:hypothetical protein